MVLRRPTKDCPVCSNWRCKRDEMGNLVMRRCTHKGRRYVLNGAYEITLCVCCTRRLLRQGNTAKEIV
jgi:hypothetical protein